MILIWWHFVLLGFLFATTPLLVLGFDEEQSLSKLLEMPLDKIIVLRMIGRLGLGLIFFGFALFYFPVI